MPAGKVRWGENNHANCNDIQSLYAFTRRRLFVDSTAKRSDTASARFRQVSAKMMAYSLLNNLDTSFVHLTPTKGGLYGRGHQSRLRQAHRRPGRGSAEC
jgi:hypothetical protein